VTADAGADAAEYATFSGAEETISEEDETIASAAAKGKEY